MIMKVQIASDIHLEFRSHDIPHILKPSADVLILAGDICLLGAAKEREIFTKFIEHYSKYFKYIVHVAGNHEYYVGERKDYLTTAEIQKFAVRLSKTIPNYYFLHNRVLPITDPKTKKIYYFAGTTLWTHIPDDKKKFIAEGMNDYNKILIPEKNTSPPIRPLTPDVVNQWHKEATSFIRRTTKKYKNVVLITHHKPFIGYELSRPIQKAPQRSSNFDVAYEVDMTSLLKDPIIAAFYGHTHHRHIAKVNGIPIISNPRGYPYERTQFDPACTLNI